MPKLSQKKIDKISEQLLSIIYNNFPKVLFTSKIAEELARDEEFIKQLLLKLEKKQLVVAITKNSKGINYKKRTSWRLSNNVHKAYIQHQK